MQSTLIAGHMDVSKDIHALSRRAAEWLTETANALPGIIRIALSGGSTPKELYTLLASDAYRSRIPWDRLELFWGDERLVPHDSSDSNFRMVADALLSRVPIPVEHIHPVPVDDSAGECARRYERVLKEAYGADALDRARPLFDIVLLGLGSDGHTCSLLPGQPVLDERTRWVAPVPFGREEARITLTYPAIESSRAIAFLVSGADKSAAVEAVRSGDESLPAARIAAQGDVIWFVDEAASGRRAG